MNDNLPEPGADGAAEADVSIQPVTTDIQAAAEPAGAEPAGAEPVVAEPVVAEPAAIAAQAPDATVPPEPPAEDGPGVPPVPVLEPVRPLDGEAGKPPATRKQNTVAIVGTVALVVAIAFGGGFAAGRVTVPATDEGTAVATQAPEETGGASGEPAATIAPGATTEPEITPVPSEGPDLPSDGSRLGKADAPIVIDYWADYQCPFCSKFAQEVIPALVPWIEDGTVQLVHRDFAFLGPESTQAAIAVRCADREGKYWWMHDAVYAAQDGENQGAFADARLIDIAGSIGLDTEAFEACLAERDLLIEVLDDTSAGNRVGIESTPTMDINGVRLLGVPKMADVEDAIAAAVAGATPAPLPTQRPAEDPWAVVDLDGRAAGSSTAPLTVELWMDYQATDSKAIVESLEPELRTRVADGAIRVVQKDLALLGEESVTASAAVRCFADQGGPAWLLHDILAVNARGAGSGIYTVDAMLRVATQLGLEVAKLDACLADPATAAAVADETAKGKALGFENGPAVLVRKGDQEVARFTGPIDTKAVLAAIDGAKGAGG